MRAPGSIAAVLLLATLDAYGQAEPAASAGTPDASRSWNFGAAAYAYFVPEDSDYVLPILTADHGPLHLEARYNYEARDAGSVWAGYTFSGGDRLAWEVAPILGAVFGELRGVAPGYEASLAWWKLELYSEGEYVIADDSEENFTYNWSELSLAAPDWFRFGLVVQRTRAYETERDIQRGLLVGFMYKRFDLSGYVFNPDDADPTVIVALGLSF